MDHKYTPPIYGTSFNGNGCSINSLHEAVGNVRQRREVGEGCVLRGFPVQRVRWSQIGTSDDCMRRYWAYKYRYSYTYSRYNRWRKHARKTEGH
jgi:hypothetical protein